MTLVDYLTKAILYADNCGPNWLHAVEDALIRQDMDYMLDAIDSDTEVAAIRAEAEEQIQRLLWSG